MGGYKSIKSYALEFIVIFVSISIAFLSENWREQLQDEEDFDLILSEIHANLMQDSIEFEKDIASIQKQIHSIDRLLDTANPCPKDSLGKYYSQFMYHYRWPDIKSTGIGQLRNSKNLLANSEIISEIISEINNYYTWTEYLKESTPYQYVLPQNKFNEWIIENELISFDAEMETKRMENHKALPLRLEHLRNTKKLQINNYKRGLAHIMYLLNLFKENNPPD